MSGELYFIGDVHGCRRALDRILDACELVAADTVVLLGDVIDRGPDSRGVLQTIIDLGSACTTHLILGNHEEMFLNALNGFETSSWLRFGGRETLESYRGSLKNVPASHRDLLSRAVPWWEGEHDIGVHANLEPDVSLAEQSAEWLRWRSITGRELPHPSGKRVVCGHSGQLVGGGLPLIWTGWVCIDTLVYRGGFLTCLAARSGEILQANESGHFRRGAFLSDLA